MRRARAAVSDAGRRRARRSTQPWPARLAQQLAVGQTAEELARLDQRSCPVCGITFYEFRNQGRLGCPHDYVCFEKELEPLIVNIHGETEHKGKKPKHGAGGTQQRTELIRLRREMKEAIEEENYERAKELRDEIKRVEENKTNRTRTFDLSKLKCPWNSTT